MRILVVGAGGREHALAWKLAQEAEVIVAPGNPGIAEDCECAAIGSSDSDALANLCWDRKVDLVVVGPEDPLVNGLADHLRAAGIAVYGPSSAGAKLEASKAFSKEMMARAGVPTADGRSFDDYESARRYAKSRFEQGRGVAVKASGNALGKGVIVCSALEQAEEALQRMMVAMEFGEAGSTVVIEDRLVGREFSLLTIVGEHNTVSLPLAQDYKRIFDGDEGPNTGGMGTYSPVGWMQVGLLDQVEQEIVAPTVGLLRSEGIQYRGTLFSGIMVDSGRPYCIEYNVRFGDPETQTLMMRLGTGFARALRQTAEGESIDAPEVLANAAATVVLASGGYPGAVKKGLPIHIGPVPAGVKLFHAGTAMAEGQLVTNGGRVLGVTAVGESVQQARSLAYEAVGQIHIEGMQYRKDIAAGR